MKKIILIALAGAVLPGAAAAQDAAISGPYVGVQAGWGKRSLERDFGVEGIPLFDESRTGIDYGVFAGYDAPIGESFVIGAEVGVGRGGKTLRADIVGIDVEAKPRWNFDVSARAGFLASPNLLIYGRVGYAAERLRVSATSETPDLIDISDSGWNDGLMFGGGIEVGLGGSASIRAEYRRRDGEADYKADQILGGISFRF